jgi:hypothetical protein
MATEMKSYAKTLPGSVWAVDRRRDEQVLPLAAAAASEYMRDRGSLVAGESVA